MTIERSNPKPAGIGKPATPPPPPPKKEEIIVENKQDLTMPIASVEMQEFLFAETLAKVAAKCEQEKHNVVDWSDLKKHVRESFRFQRFAVMNWLLMNGVSVPLEMLTDNAHPTVGNQFPDQSG